MITKATLSILGLYRYDPTIFSEMWLPAVITDKGDEHLVYEQILLEYAELEVLYPDPAVMKQAISVLPSSRQGMMIMMSVSGSTTVICWPRRLA